MNESFGGLKVSWYIIVCSKWKLFMKFASRKTLQYFVNTVDDIKCVLCKDS